MIYTRHGAPVTIIARYPHFESTGWVVVSLPGGICIPMQVYELHADGGANEIDAAALAAPEWHYEPRQSDPEFDDELD